MKRIAAATTALALLPLAVMSGCQPADTAVALSGDGLALYVSPQLHYDTDTGQATVRLLILNYGPDPVFVDTDMQIGYHGEIAGPEVAAFGGAIGHSMILGPSSIPPSRTDLPNRPGQEHFPLRPRPGKDRRLQRPRGDHRREAHADDQRLHCHTASGPK